VPVMSWPKYLLSPTVRALALWLNASITAQKAAESSASFFEGIRFIFIGAFLEISVGVN
jgi:hypothetical protein